MNRAVCFCWISCWDAHPGNACLSTPPYMSGLLDLHSYLSGFLYGHCPVDAHSVKPADDRRRNRSARFSAGPCAIPTPTRAHRSSPLRRNTPRDDSTPPSQVAGIRSTAGLHRYRLSLSLHPCLLPSFLASSYLDVFGRFIRDEPVPRVACAAAQRVRSPRDALQGLRTRLAIAEVTL